MERRLLLAGLSIWALGTIALRLGGGRLLGQDNWLWTLVLYALSFPIMALLVRRVCVRLRVPPDRWIAGAVWIVLPTLLLDAFSSAFFPAVFPNIAPQQAGLFGGWMLWCCASGLVGAILGRSNAK